MLRALQHIILWGKFRSLNKRYQTLIEHAENDRGNAANQHVEENFWYETAILLEQRRRLQSPPTARNSVFSKGPAPTASAKATPTSRIKTKNPGPLPPYPPSSLFIIIFSFLGSIAVGTGIFWLIAPLLSYVRLYFHFPMNLLDDLFPDSEVPAFGLLHEVAISLPIQF